ncbi:hypothetical protein GCM10010330_49150 [Streptomyces tendae]|nr:hypothetical protein GCM10010330_49150 [Streptomyces tendae]
MDGRWGADRPRTAISVPPSVTSADKAERLVAAGAASRSSARGVVANATVRGVGGASGRERGVGRPSIVAVPAGPGAAGLLGRNRLAAMLDVLTLVTGVAALLLAAWCGWAAYRDQPTKDWHFIGMAVVSALALIQLVVGVVQLARGEEPEQGTTIFVAYLLGAFACVPAAGFMSLAERTRWGSVTVAAGGVVLAVLEVRLFDIWGG